MSKNTSGSGKGNDGGVDRNAASHHNREQQLNPNNDRYWQSRGEEGRPVDWEDRTKSAGQ